MSSSLHLIGQIDKSLKAESPSQGLLDTLNVCADDLSAGSELFEFFEEVAARIGFQLTVVKDEVEIATISLSPIQPVYSCSRVEPGSYQAFIEGRLVWQEELKHSDLVVESEFPLAASDKEAVERKASVEVFLSGFSVWLSVIPSIESGTLKFKLE